MAQPDFTSFGYDPALSPAQALSQADFTPEQSQQYQSIISNLGLMGAGIAFPVVGAALTGAGFANTGKKLTQGEELDWTDAANIAGPLIGAGIGKIAARFGPALRAAKAARDPSAVAQVTAQIDNSIASALKAKAGRVTGGLKHFTQRPGAAAPYEGATVYTGYTRPSGTRVDPRVHLGQNIPKTGTGFPEVTGVSPNAGVTLPGRPSGMTYPGALVNPPPVPTRVGAPARFDPPTIPGRAPADMTAVGGMLRPPELPTRAGTGLPARQMDILRGPPPPKPVSTPTGEFTTPSYPRPETVGPLGPSFAPLNVTQRGAMVPPQTPASPLDVYWFKSRAPDPAAQVTIPRPVLSPSAARTSEELTAAVPGTVVRPGGIPTPPGMARGIRDDFYDVARRSETPVSSRHRLPLADQPGRTQAGVVSQPSPVVSAASVSSRQQVGPAIAPGEAIPPWSPQRAHPAPERVGRRFQVREFEPPRGVPAPVAGQGATAAQQDLGLFAPLMTLAGAGGAALAANQFGAPKKEMGPPLDFSPQNMSLEKPVPALTPEAGVTGATPAPPRPQTVARPESAPRQPETAGYVVKSGDRLGDIAYAVLSSTGKKPSKSQVHTKIGEFIQELGLKKEDFGKDLAVGSVLTSAPANLAAPKGGMIKAFGRAKKPKTPKEAQAVVAPAFKTVPGELGVRGKFAQEEAEAKILSEKELPPFVRGDTSQAGPLRRRAAKARAGIPDLSGIPPAAHRDLGAQAGPISGPTPAQTHKKMAADAAKSFASFLADKDKPFSQEVAGVVQSLQPLQHGGRAWGSFASGFSAGMPIGASAAMRKEAKKKTTPFDAVKDFTKAKVAQAVQATMSPRSPLPPRSPVPWGVPGGAGKHVDPRFARNLQQSPSWLDNLLGLNQ